MTRIAAVIVTYNSAAEIGACLDSLGSECEVVVVDNASEDASASVAARPGVLVVENAANRGFAAAVNQGARATQAPLILILNPDTVVEQGLDELAALCEHHGIAAGKLTDRKGNAQAGFTIRRFPTATTLAFESTGLNLIWPENPANRRYRYLDRDLTVDGWSDQPAGAFLMVRRDVFNQLGGMDESFFPVWFEDVDFLKRAAKAGYRAWYYSGSSAWHKGGHSVGRIHRESRTWYWYVSLLRYAAKHFSTMQFRVVCGAVAIGCLMRALRGVFKVRRISAVDGSVARMAVSSLWAGRLRVAGTLEEKWNGTSKPILTLPVSDR